MIFESLPLTTHKTQTLTELWTHPCAADISVEEQNCSTLLFSDIVSLELASPFQLNNPILIKHPRQSATYKMRKKNLQSCFASTYQGKEEGRAGSKMEVIQVIQDPSDWMLFRCLLGRTPTWGSYRTLSFSLKCLNCFFSSNFTSAWSLQRGS